MSVSVLLAVDDRPDNLFVLKQLMETDLLEIKMITAESAEAGLALAATESIDGALIDVQMPGLNGIEMCRRLKSDPRTAPMHVILVTAPGATSELKAQGLEAGADDFISKPIDNVELAAKLRAMLRLRAAEDALCRERNHLEEAVQERTQALQEAENRYRTLFQTAGDPIFINDLEGDLLEVNEESCRLLGSTREELLLLKVSDLVTPGNAARRPELLKQLQATDVLVFETELVTHGRRIIPTECRSRMMDFQGRPAVLSIARDISERKAAAAVLRESETRYRELFEKNSDATMIFDAETHRFEDANAATLSLFGYTREEFLELTVADISAEPDQTRALIPRLVTGEAGPRIPLRYQKKKDGSVFPVEISAGVYFAGGRRKIIGAVRDITARRRAEEALRQSEALYRSLVELRWATPVAPIYLFGLAGLLPQAFLSLFSNALSAMPDGGILSISLEGIDQEEVITITDTGPGIATTDLPYIFDPFFTTAAAGQGTGLGLSLCYAIIKQHFGSIELENTPGQGARFTVRLPRGPWSPGASP